MLMELGPVQIVVIGLGGAELVGELVPELRRLGEYDGIRLIDVVLLHKDDSGRLTKLDMARWSPAESAEFGDAAELLVGGGGGGAGSLGRRGCRCRLGARRRWLLRWSATTSGGSVELVPTQITLRPSSCARLTASRREDAPSLR
jgi:hypothetical protein